MTLEGWDCPTLDLCFTRPTPCACDGGTTQPYCEYRDPSNYEKKFEEMYGHTPWYCECTEEMKDCHGRCPVDRIEEEGEIGFISDEPCP